MYKVILIMIPNLLYIFLIFSSKGINKNEFITEYIG